MIEQPVVTGMAWSTALGTGLTDVWKRLLAGEDGMRAVPSPHPLRNDLAAAVDDPPAGLDAPERQRAMAAGTLTRALTDARLGPGAEPYPVIGTSFGAHLDGDDEDLGAWARDVTARAGLRRTPVVVSTACSSGADAVAVGADILRSGTADVCVCGAADVLSPAKRLGHSVIGTMSPTRLRAFDPRADGTLLGEGAGFLVLETEASARERGVSAYAVLSGAGAANDGVSMTAPEPGGTGIALAVRRSLAGGGLGPGDVAVINAHATGTRANDAAEANGLNRLFGECAAPPVVFATKGALGHSLGATGVVEAITVILALGHGCAPPVSGVARVADGLGLPVPVGAPLPLGPGAGLSLTAGFGGFITCLAFEGRDRDAT